MPSAKSCSTSSIGFSQFRMLCHVGVSAHERQSPQEILLSIEVGYDFSKCFVTDALENTLDYEQMSQACQEIALRQPYCLLETLAHHLIEGLRSRFSISWAKVRLDKPAALSHAQSAFVTLEKVF